MGGRAGERAGAADPAKLGRTLSTPRCASASAGRFTLRPGSANIDPRRENVGRVGIVRFENVGLRYGADVETLSDLSFTLEEGGFYFLTGPSGAGKSSLLRLLYLAGSPARATRPASSPNRRTVPRVGRPAR